MNAEEYLNQYYAGYDEEGRLLTRHGHVEFATTVRYAEKYLRPDMHILEIGAGTGRYSHYFARAGYAVDAVELVQHNIDQFRALTQPEEVITIRQGTACNLSDFPDDAYDLTLLLGPMYHLFTEDEKLAALREAIRVTKKGGVILAAYCMADPSILSYGFMKGNALHLVEQGLLDPLTFCAASTPQELFELHRKEDIDALRSHFPVTQLHFVAADGYANHMRDALSAMDEATYRLYLQYHFSTCERADMTGYSHHTLDIFRKD